MEAIPEFKTAAHFRVDLLICNPPLALQTNRLPQQISVRLWAGTKSKIHKIINQQKEFAFGHLLHLVQPALMSVLVDELLMCSRLNNFPLLQHYTRVGILYGAKAVNNNNRSTVLHQVVQRFLYQSFRSGIQC